ncbi:ABC transporter ATP-binding protein/permease [Pasteurella testudinis]|nr:ABC transporter ATP-binding protein/permease [Pasteurella testudinis]
MKQFFVRLFVLCKPFWGKKSNWLAWLLLGLVIAIGSVIAWINIQINEWSKVFYDTLTALETEKIYLLLQEYSLYLLIFIVINVYRTWLRKLLIIRWREAMTERFVNQWLSDRIFYKLAQRKKMDNPDQRIAEDIRIFIEYSIELTVSFLFNMIQLYSFLMILWGLSGAPEFTFFGHTFVIKGYLVWVALIYSVLGTAITHLIGRKLHTLNYHQQVFEANFRSGLIRKQDNAEQIALYRGEQVERITLKNEFRQIVQNWRLLMNRERNLGFFTVGYDRFANLLPVIFSIPLLLAKIITFGGIMQIRSAFSVVINALSWFIFAYSILPKWSAAISRLSQLKEEMDALQAGRPTAAQPTELAIDTERLSVFTPQNNVLLRDLSLKIQANQWIHLQGKSGLGKSTLLRVLSGIWDYYQGDYKQPDKTTLLVPQRSYFSGGNLADVLSYPEVNRYTIDELNQVLALVGLNAWQNRLEEIHNWQTLFSGGEQQRVAFARVLLNKPELLYLDEATSNLDETTAQDLMRLIKARLPNTTVVYISHQQTLQQFADHSVDLSVYAFD